MAIVPNVAGLTLSQGSAQLTQAGFTNQRHVDQNGNPVSNGDAEIFSTDPSGGAEANTTDPIQVTCSAEAPA